MPVLLSTADVESRQDAIRERLHELDAMHTGCRMPEPHRREWDRLMDEMRGLGGRLPRRGRATRRINDLSRIPDTYMGMPIITDESFSDGRAFGAAAEWTPVTVAIDPAFTYGTGTGTMQIANPDQFLAATTSTTYTVTATFTTNDTTAWEAFQGYEHRLQRLADTSRRAAADMHTLADRATRVGNQWMEYHRNVYNAYGGRPHGRVAPMIEEVSEEVRAERAAAQREQQERYAEQARIRREAEVAAQARAEALLLRHLNEQQATEWRTHKHFHVETADGRRCYRIRHGLAGNVDVVRDDDAPPGVCRRDDGVLRRYCCHVVGAMPIEDNVLTQKLWLETRESEFLAMANPYP